MLLFKFNPKNQGDIDSARHFLLLNVLCQSVYEAKVGGEEIAKVKGEEIAPDSDLAIGIAVAGVFLVHGKTRKKNLFLKQMKNCWIPNEQATRPPGGFL